MTTPTDHELRSRFELVCESISRPQRSAHHVDFRLDGSECVYYEENETESCKCHCLLAHALQMIMNNRMANDIILDRCISLEKINKTLKTKK